MHPDAEKLAALEADLRKDLDAIERVKRLMAFKNGSLSPPPDDRQYRLPVSPSTMDHGEEEAEAGPPKTLIGTIEQIMNADPNIRWTTTRMLNQLQSIQYPLGAKKPVYSVGQAIQKLLEKGRIRIIKRGSGNAPNIYKGRVLTESNNGDLTAIGAVTE